MAERKKSEANTQLGRAGLGRIWHAMLISLHGLRAGWGETAFRQEAMLAILMIPLALLLAGGIWLAALWHRFVV